MHCLSIIPRDMKNFSVMVLNNTFYLGTYKRRHKTCTHTHTHTSEFSQIFMYAYVHTLIYTVQAPKKANANTQNTCAHAKTVHILPGGMKLDLQLNNSSRQITRGSSRKGKRQSICWMTAALGTKRCCLTTSALDR